MSLLEKGILRKNQNKIKKFGNFAFQEMSGFCWEFAQNVILFNLTRSTSAGNSRASLVKSLKFWRSNA